MDEQERDTRTNWPHAFMVGVSWVAIVAIVLIVATQCG